MLYGTCYSASPQCLIEAIKALPLGQPIRRPRNVAKETACRYFLLSEISPRT